MKKDMLKKIQKPNNKKKTIPSILALKKSGRYMRWWKKPMNLDLQHIPGVPRCIET
jgi:hypothetical protein